MSNPTLLEMPIARDGAKNSIPSTTSPTTGLLSQQFGWQDINSMPVQQGGKAPSRLDFNGVLNLLSKIIFYAQKGFTFEYDETQDYYKNCIVLDPADGKMYRAKNNVSASTTHPSADSTNWELFDLLTLLANYLPLSGGTMTGNLKTKDVAILSGSHIRSTVGNEQLELWGGAGPNSGANLTLFGAYRTDDFKGVAELRAVISGQNTNLLCYPDGRMTWDTNDLAGSAIVAKADNYIKYASGLIKQWGVSVPDGTERTFPISFTSNRYLIVCPILDNTNYWVFFDDLSVSDKLSKYKLTAKTMEGGVGYSGNAVWFAIGY